VFWFGYLPGGDPGRGNCGIQAVVAAASRSCLCWSRSSAARASVRATSASVTGPMAGAWLAWAISLARIAARVVNAAHVGGDDSRWWLIAERRAARCGSAGCRLR
jgi:hypothetical protein